MRLMGNEFDTLTTWRTFQRLWLGLWSQEDSVLIQEIQDEDVDYFHCCRNVKKRIDISDF